MPKSFFKNPKVPRTFKNCSKMPKLLNKCPKMPCARFSPVGRVYMFRIHLHDRIVADSIYTAPMDDPTVAIDNGFVLLTQHDPSLSTSFWLLLSGLTTPKQNKRRLNENRSLLLSRTDTTRLCWRRVPLCLPGRPHQWSRTLSSRPFSSFARLPWHGVPD